VKILVVEDVSSADVAAVTWTWFS